MKSKAQANLKASQQLLKANLVDPAMSRLYYALFQAGVHRMAVLKKTPAEFRQGAKDEWEHALLCGNASVLRNRRDDMVLFREARSLREDADYRAFPVDRDEVASLLPEIERFVQDVCA